MSGKPWSTNCSHIQGVLLDISGVLYNSDASGGKAIPGSPEAVKRLKASNLKVRFCTNESQHMRDDLVKKLQRLGFDLEVSEVFSPAPAACQMIQERRLVPHLLVAADIVPEFDKVKNETTPPSCVVIGDAPQLLNYESMNTAFQVLMKQKNPLLISLGIGKYYKEGGELLLDVGPFTKALEYATDCKVEVIGKPSPAFFNAPLKDMGIKPENVIMIGDDIVNDIGGAQKCGMMGLQVRTGKFRPSDENHPLVTPDGYVDNLASAVDDLLKALQTG